MPRHNLKYDKCHVIRDGEGSVYDKLQMFRDFTDDVNYLYFDLDVVIKGDVKGLQVVFNIITNGILLPFVFLY